MAWKPGESGNPAGVAKIPRIARFTHLISHGTPKQIADRIVEQALKGNPKDSLTSTCLKLVVERLWPAIQRVEQSSTVNAAISNKHEISELTRYLKRDELKEIQEAAKKIAAKSAGIETGTDETVH